MAGGTRLAATLGMGHWGAWAAGLFYGLSGYVLSTANFFELFHAAAWGPWVAAAALRLWAEPGPRRIAALAFLGAVQVATLSAETVLQTGAFSLALLPGRPDRRRSGATGTALVLVLLLAAPTLLGVQALVRETLRQEGLPAWQSFAFSLRPIVLLDAVLPRFFGDVHTFSSVGYWGQLFFPSGYPYLLSLYCGPALLWLASRSGGPAAERWRLTGLAALGILLALGSHGPLEWALAPLMRHFRSPPKFLFMSNLAVCLLAARAIDAGTRAEARPRLLALVPGGLLAGLGLALLDWPQLPGRALGGFLPELLDPRAQSVIATSWPSSFVIAGALYLAAVLALRLRALAPLSAVIVGLDLLIANGSVNLTTAPAFYALRPEVAKLVEDARREGTYRFFAYSSDVPGLKWSAAVARRNADVWLYYLDRQSLVPRMHVLDGLEGAFDEDRVGWAPRHSTIGPNERFPSRYRRHHPWLRLANVRFVLSFRPLPDDLVRPREEASLPEVEEPLRLYELKDPLPRAFRVERYETVRDEAALRRRLDALDFDPREVVLLETAPVLPPPRPGSSLSSGSVEYERVDPHTVRLKVAGPRGLVVVAEGHHPDWSVEASGERRPLLRANGRYWAVPTAGGGETVTVRFAPSWRSRALACCGLGLVGVLALALSPNRPDRFLHTLRGWLAGVS
jgi:hypothetical protein